jgi:hypothetical protein
MILPAVVEIVILIRVFISPLIMAAERTIAIVVAAPVIAASETVVVALFVAIAIVAAVL